MESQDDIKKRLGELESKEAQLGIEKSLILSQALGSKDVETIYKAQQYIANIEKKGESTNKSLLIDPQSFGSSGYKDKSFRLSYEVLRNMSRIPVVKAVIETRKEQILSFCEPQVNKYSTGFIIQPKGLENGKEMNRNQRKRADELTEFIMNCGENSNSFHGDNFNSFSRKFIDDSLTLDQGCWENIYGPNGKEFVEFIATDGATYRIADSHNDTERRKEKEKRGYLPYYVQVYNGTIFQEFYPWELVFAIRNPQTSIYSNGYGKSELEDLVQTITSMINADMYNSNYFRVGSNPKGILRVTGNVNTSRLEEFRSQWQNQMAGVRNAHKLPIIEAEKMDFINTQTSNKDMEYSQYQEYLIKLVCAAYKIDPSEIGFPMSGSSDAKPMFEGNNEARLKYSRDKGLKPTIKFYERYLNQYILGIKDPNFELKFVGIDAESPEQELERNIKEVAAYKTVNEVRSSAGLKPIEGGDVILNPVFLQAQQMQQMGNEQSNQALDQEEPQPQEEENPFLKAIVDETERYFSI